MGKYTLHFTTWLEKYTNVILVVEIEIWVYPPCDFPILCQLFEINGRKECGTWIARLPSSIFVFKNSSTLSFKGNKEYFFWSEYFCIFSFDLLDDITFGINDCLHCGARE